MSWFLLLLAAVAETLFVLEMKLSDGFTQWNHSILSIGIMGVGVFLLSLVVRRIPVATAYAIWTGLGIVGTILLESYWEGQTLSLGRVVCILLILIGAVGLKLLPVTS